MKSNTTHRKLTERERDRMVDLYALGPLTYIPEIDDPLFKLDLISYYDSDKETKAVDNKHPSDFFYAKNGIVLEEWYIPRTNVPDEMHLPEKMQCRMCHAFKVCQKVISRKGPETICDWYPSRFKEQEWHCYTLCWSDLIEIAERKGLSLNKVDIDNVIRSIKDGIEAALDNRNEIIEEAIVNAGRVVFDGEGGA